MSEYRNTIVNPLRILKYLRLHGRVSSEELSKELNIEKRTMRRYCDSLKASGYSVMSKAGKNGGYWLEEPEITQEDWKTLKDLLPKELYEKIEYRLLEEFKPSE